MENSTLILKMRVILMNEDIDQIERILMVRKMSYHIRKPGKLTLEEVSELVENHTGIPSDVFSVKSRKRKVVVPRQLAHCIAKAKTDETLSSIGFFFGRKDHATVLHSIKTVANLIEVDTAFKEDHKDFLNQFL